MFHGGSNFGITSGATISDDMMDSYKADYMPRVTSYDFGVPLDEVGDPTEKYFPVQQTLKGLVD